MQGSVDQRPRDPPPGPADAGRTAVARSYLRLAAIRSPALGSRRPRPSQARDPSMAAPAQRVQRADGAGSLEGRDLAETRDSCLVSECRPAAKCGNAGRSLGST
jgi:hypothetical protein